MFELPQIFIGLVASAVGLAGVRLLDRAPAKLLIGFSIFCLMSPLIPWAWLPSPSHVDTLSADPLLLSAAILQDKTLVDGAFHAYLPWICFGGTLVWLSATLFRHLSALKKASLHFL